MDWKEYLADNITNAGQLKDYLSLNRTEVEKLNRILQRYPMNITQYYLGLVNWNHYERDPIFLQCIPSISEADMSGEYDTSGEAMNTVMQGIQHKYPQTALILSTQKCAMYCRHCFRKRLVGIEDQKETAVSPAQAAAYIRNHPEINNVLISGGDAFLNDNQIIQNYLEELSVIPHLDFIRFGTRTPVTFPMRIYDDDELLYILHKYSGKKQLIVVTHFNHPQEITQESIRAVRTLQSVGITVRNQTVLLRRINDQSKILSRLMRDLTSIGVIPYYIFQCRPAAGVRHQFQVPILTGFQIVEEAKSRLDGQGKCFRHVMSHVTGKIEFIGPTADGQMIMKYHQARDEADRGRIFLTSIDENQCWISSIPRQAQS